MNDTVSKGRSATASVLSHAVPIYVVAVSISAVALAAGGWWMRPLNGDDVVALVVLCLMGIFSESVRENNVGRKATLSFTSIVLLSSVALVGPFGAAVVGASTLLAVNKDRPQVRVFNSGMASAIGAVGGIVYLLAGGATHVSQVVFTGPLLLHVGLPLMVADIAQALSNAVILSGIVRLAQGTPIRRFILGVLGTSGPTYVGYGIIGFLFVILWVPGEVGPVSALLIMSPLFVARWAFVQYGDEQRAHARTLSALATAVETKDLYTRGHSERVAVLCDLMAGSLGLSQQETETLRFAGMLHDIGKLAIPTRALRRAGEISDDDLVRIATHPERGVEMVRDIDFLEGSIEAIRHHHERMDGRGYPAGLRGEEIPLFARIIAVADAFDSLTTSRTHRDAHTVGEATAALRRRAGTHLDPSIVDALERGLVRQVWEPTQLEPRLMATAGRAFDHDDPNASDLMAGLASSELADPESDGFVPLRVARETAP
ncbi:MAG: HD-GYP domain-containing protein [Phycicoccus sp.]|nr:HD-GYP domain-containing protein [Phycicoccus sp.]